jgi:hypothetical protein
VQQHQHQQQPQPPQAQQQQRPRQPSPDSSDGAEDSIAERRNRALATDDLHHAGR